MDKRFLEFQIFPKEKRGEDNFRDKWDSRALQNLLGKDLFMKTFSANSSDKDERGDEECG